MKPIAYSKINIKLPDDIETTIRNKISQQPENW